MGMKYNEEDCQAALNFWKSKGFNDYAICGWLANWYVESALRSDNAQNGYMKKFGITDEQYVTAVDNGTWLRPDNGKGFCADSIGFGLSQWTSAGRKSGLYNFIKSKGLSIADRQAQMDFAYVEITTNAYKGLYTMLLNATSAGQAAIDIMKYYERPASKDNPSAQQVRASYAEEFYTKYFGGKPKMKTLALSAGHYLYTSGKRCLKSIDPTETREWVLNARIADKLTTILNRYEDVKVLRLDDPTGEVGISIQQRAKVSDANNADFYLAIHHNAGIKGGSGGGIVVYRYPNTSKYPDTTEVATNFYQTVLKHNKLRGNRANPIVTTKSLYEVAAPYARSFLLENGFMDSTYDTPIILTEEFAQNTAEGIAEFFVNYWGLKLKEDESKSDILAEIEAIKVNIAALEKRLEELQALL